MKPEEELIQLRAENQALREQLAQRDARIEQVLQRVHVLEKRVSKDSQESSLLPSSDRFARQKTTRSLRKPSGKQAGGQADPPGSTLSMSEAAEEVICLPVTQCQHCQADLSTVAVASIERRRVVDVPLPRLQVTEYQAEGNLCSHCQRATRAAFPQAVTAPVHYGPGVGATAVSLLIQQRLPWERTGEVLADLLGVHRSEGTLARLIERTARPLVEVEEQIRAAVIRAKVLHQDETGRYVNKRRAWMHGTSTKKLTHYQVHQSRGKKALDASGILANFTGVSVHECWATYVRSGCQHALCLVHIVTLLADELGLWCAASLKRLLLTMKNATEQARSQGLSCLSEPVVAAFTATFLALLSEGDQVHLRVKTPAGKRGKARQYPGRNLLDRLRTHRDAVLRFLNDLHVPFDLAEQDLRLVKVQQKVSGAFRSTEGAVSFCCIRGSLSTLRIQGLHIFSALEATLRGQPFLPSFSET